MSKFLMGIDIGTTNVKSVLFHEDGTKIAEHSVEYPICLIKSGWVEQDPQEWWEATVKTILRVLEDSRVDKKDIAGIGVSSQAPTLIPIDRDGNVLRNGLIWMDRRSQPETDFLETMIGSEKVKSITGNRIDPYYLSSKLLWYMNHEPELYKKTYKILQINGYINYMLTGAITTDISHASLMGVFDVRQNRWSTELADLIGYDPDLLPRVYENAHVIGTVSGKAARLTGLSTTTAVVCGTVDGAAATLEAGAVEIGDAVEMTGTSTVLNICTDHWRDPGLLFEMYHGLKDVLMICGASSTTGASLKWFKENLHQEEVNEKINPFELLSRQAGNAKAGSGKLIFLHYMAGERSPIWDSYARGAFFGLHLNTKKEEMIRAILEGSAYGLRHNIDEAKNIGVSIRELRCVGGGSKSDIWLKIKASVLNMPVVVPDISTGAPFGGAIIAGAGVGIYKSPGQFAKEAAKIKKIVEPNAEWHKVYNELYEVYISLYKNVKTDFYRLADIQEGV
jgi:xylulokinase